MDKAFVAQGVARKLWATENSVDQAMAEASQLLAAMVEARMELKVSAVTGDVAYGKVAEAIATLAQARSALVEAHGALEETKLRVGVRTKMAGQWDKDDPTLPFVQLVDRQAS